MSFEELFELVVPWVRDRLHFAEESDFKDLIRNLHEADLRLEPSPREWNVAIVHRPIHGYTVAMQCEHQSFPRPLTGKYSFIPVCLIRGPYAAATHQSHIVTGPIGPTGPVGISGPIGPTGPSNLELYLGLIPTAAAPGYSLKGTQTGRLTGQGNTPSS